MSKSFERNDIRTFGAIATFRIQELIARSDHGIAQIGDLSGKKIGITVGSSGEAALDRFLTPNGLTFSVGLSQALILAMEDEARWRIDISLTDKNEVPNYLDFLYLEALEAVNPESVTVIR